MNATTILIGALTPESIVVLGAVAIGLLIIVPLVFGPVLIHERQVGIVIKKLGLRSLDPGKLIALNGESGYQADTLAPGLHLWFWRWQYRILKVPITIVPQGEIALVMAADGAAIPPECILGKVVACDNFQDARR